MTLRESKREDMEVVEAEEGHNDAITLQFLKLSRCIYFYKHEKQSWRVKRSFHIYQRKNVDKH